jgi:polysaccharide export outer membrane protein
MRGALVGALVVAAASLGVAGCAQVPSGAPTASEFERSEDGKPATKHFFVEMDSKIAATLSNQRANGLAASFGASNYRPSLILRPGDTISITIFDFSAVPLFGASGPNLPSGVQANGHIATIPSQVVELDGAVVIPFAGSVKVGGLTPLQAGLQIERSLKGAATDAHVVVTSLTSTENVATAGGELGRPGIVPLTVRGERVLDLIAAAGGAKYPAQDCQVQLTRRGRAAKVNLQQVVDNPEENIVLQPGDSVFVSYDPRTFSVLGAALKVSQYDFNMPKVTVAEALARAGGPNSAAANVSDVFLLRFESAATLKKILPPGEVDRLENAEIAPAPSYPVAYHIDLRHADGYFQSQALQIRNKDLIVVADADSVQVQEVLQVVRNITGIAYDLSPITRQAEGTIQ